MWGRGDRRRRFITAQVHQVALQYSGDGIGIRFDEDQCNWLLVPRYKMPPRWQQEVMSLLIWFGPSYPDTPPTGFYLSGQSSLRNGGVDGHLFDRSYYDAPDFSGQRWRWYCVRAQIQQAGGWRPSADPLAPDNLATFLDLAREALTVDE
jgi:hypothetical protein